MKKNIVFIGLMVLGGLVFIGCMTAVGSIKQEWEVKPDPANPFQGTWISVAGDNFINYMHVIEGMSGKQYNWFQLYFGKWHLQNVYIIEKEGNEYRTSLQIHGTSQQIRVDNDILTVGGMTFTRVKK